MNNIHSLDSIERANPSTIPITHKYQINSCYGNFLSFAMSRRAHFTSPCMPSSGHTCGQLHRRIHLFPALPRTCHHPLTSPLDTHRNPCQSSSLHAHFPFMHIDEYLAIQPPHIPPAMDMAYTLDPQIPPASPL